MQLPQLRLVMLSTTDDRVLGQAAARLGVEQVGECDGVEELFFAITPRKKIEHRLVQRIIAGGLA